MHRGGGLSAASLYHPCIQTHAYLTRGGTTQGGTQYCGLPPLYVSPDPCWGPYGSVIWVAGRSAAPPTGVQLPCSQWPPKSCKISNPASPANAWGVWEYGYWDLKRDFLAPTQSRYGGAGGVNGALCIASPWAPLPAPSSDITWLYNGPSGVTCPGQPHPGTVCDLFQGCSKDQGSKSTNTILSLFKSGGS